MNNIDNYNKTRIILVIVTVCLVVIIGLYKFFALPLIKSHFESRKSVLQKVEKFDVKKNVSKPIATTQKEAKKNNNPENNYTQPNYKINAEVDNQQSISDIKAQKLEMKQVKKAVKEQKKEEKRKIKEEKRQQKKLKNTSYEEKEVLENVENLPVENINKEE